MTITLLILVALTGPASADPIDSTSRFFGGQPPPAANCEFHLRRRADLFEEIFLKYPDANPNFRRRLEWRLVRQGRVRHLVGVPKRQRENPSFFVMMPLVRDEHQPALVLNISPRAGETGWRLTQELEKIDVTIPAVPNDAPRVHHGVFFQKNSLDLLFYDVEYKNLATVGDGANVAAALANTIYDNPANLRAEVVKQHGDLGREFAEAFHWASVEENGEMVRFLGQPGDAKLAPHVRVELERGGEGGAIGLTLLVQPETSAQMIRVSEAFGAIQRRRHFHFRWLAAAPTKFKVVGAVEKFGKFSAHFPGHAPDGHADLADGLRVTLDTLAGLRRLLDEANAN